MGGHGGSRSSSRHIAFAHIRKPIEKLLCTTTRRKEPRNQQLFSEPFVKVFQNSNMNSDTIQNGKYATRGLLFLAQLLLTPFSAVSFLQSAGAGRAFGPGVLHAQQVTHADKYVCPASHTSHKSKNISQQEYQRH